MIRAMALPSKTKAGSAAPGARQGAAAKPRGMAKSTVGKSRPGRGRAAEAAARLPAATKEELRLRVEKLERANAMLRIKNKDLRVAYVEAAEQVDALTLRMQSLDRREARKQRQEEESRAAAGGRRTAAGRRTHQAGAEELDAYR